MKLYREPMLNVIEIFNKVKVIQGNISPYLYFVKFHVVFDRKYYTKDLLMT